MCGRAFWYGSLLNCALWTVSACSGSRNTASNRACVLTPVILVMVLSPAKIDANPKSLWQKINCLYVAVCWSALSGRRYLSHSRPSARLSNAMHTAFYQSNSGFHLYSLLIFSIFLLISLQSAPPTSRLWLHFLDLSLSDQGVTRQVRPSSPSDFYHLSLIVSPLFRCQERLLDDIPIISCWTFSSAEKQKQADKHELTFYWRRLSASEHKQGFSACDAVSFAQNLNKQVCDFILNTIFVSWYDYQDCFTVVHCVAVLLQLIWNSILQTWLLSWRAFSVWTVGEKVLCKKIACRHKSYK